MKFVKILPAFGAFLLMSVSIFCKDALLITKKDNSGKIDLENKGVLASSFKRLAKDKRKTFKGLI